MDLKTVGFDVGNSTVKAAWFHADHAQALRTARHHSAETIEEFVDVTLSEHPFDVAVIATVNSAASIRLTEALEKRSIPVRRVYESDGSLFDDGALISAVDTPKTIGVDRLLACIAALKESPQQNLAVVACGSAITLNLVQSNGTFLGGAILPGIGMMSRSLHEETAALPRITPPAPSEMGVGEIYDGPIPTLPGKSTISAMRAGVFYAAVGAMERLLDELEELAGPLAVHLTGGDAQYLGRALRRPHRISTNLVLEGLRIVSSKLPS